MRTMMAFAGWLQVACCLIAISILVCCSKVDRSPHCYIFPPAFRGWVSISYGVDSADYPKSTRECIVFDFTSKSNLETKLTSPVGWAEDRFRDSGSGGTEFRLSIELKDTERGIRDQYFEFIGNTTREWIFIGTKKDRESMPRPNPGAIYGK
jgi:hypothetical protein